MESAAALQTMASTSMKGNSKMEKCTAMEELSLTGVVITKVFGRTTSGKDMVSSSTKKATFSRENGPKEILMANFPSKRWVILLPSAVFGTKAESMVKENNGTSIEILNILTI